MAAPALPSGPRHGDRPSLPPRVRHTLLPALILAALTGGLGNPDRLQAQTPRSGGQNRAREGLVTVGGRVVEYETGTPLEGVAISLAAGPGGTSGLGTRVTNAEGRFLFRDVPPGAYRLFVTVLGYRAMADTLHVPPSRDLDLVLPLSADPIRLEPIVVEAERPRLAMRDFEDRRGIRSGTFISREEIEARHPIYLTDLLRRVPGGRIAAAPFLGSTLLLRGGCRPGIWIDGARISNVDGLDGLVSPNDVEAIEVYHTLELPVEFGSHPCGGVLIWTRVGTPGTGSSSGIGFWRRLAIASGFLLLGIILTR
jgi:hypothetical protein